MQGSAALPKGLPQALRPWSQTFQDMPEAHLRLIGNLMGQLNALLAETFAIEAQSLGEFNGYDGMALRGEVERLLPSEWLWRELAPEEFLRRFAEQELLYHRPSYEQPTDGRTHLVVIDCGPLMLGRPRLVALAALLCLNAIARSQGAKLLWSAPQTGVEGWRGLLVRDDVRALLSVANALPLRQSQLEELIQSLPAGGGDAELVLWTIGAAPLISADETIKTNQIVISECMALAPDGPPFAEARVALISALGRHKETVLAFPREEDCVALLREPFRIPAPARPAPATRSADDQGIMANPRWAPQEVVYQAATGRLIARVRHGLLSVHVNQTGEVEDPIFVPIDGVDTLIGVHWSVGKVILALIRQYGACAGLRVRRHGIVRKPGQQDSTSWDIPLAEDHSLVIDRHPHVALPPLIKGRGTRLIAITAKGEPFELHQANVPPFRPLRHLPLIGARGDWVFSRAGSPKRQMLIARNLFTSQCVTFALPPKAAVRDLTDILYAPDELRTKTTRMLLARADKQHWRGQAGRPNARAREQFQAPSIDVDLSALGHAFPLRLTVHPDPLPRYVALVCCPRDSCIHEASFDYTPSPPALRRRLKLSIEPPPHGQDGSRRARVVLCNAFAISWQVDEDGFVTAIDGGYHLYMPSEAPQLMRHNRVDELIGKARCLSD